MEVAGRNGPRLLSVWLSVKSTDLLPLKNKGVCVYVCEDGHIIYIHMQTYVSKKRSRLCFSLFMALQNLAT